jgi:2-polyprenyl-3-methyl-5-hydroxy-6-metoxy-1,4-benzoquinol methylase
MEDRVTITGYVTLEEFERRIAATDIALNLRERTVGETSASLCRIMAAGVPAIVFKVGSFSELPDDAVVKIEHDAHADALLEAYLKRLIEDANLRERIGTNARNYILTEHDIETSAQNYLTFLEAVVARRPRKQFVQSIADEISELGIRDNNQVLEDVAVEVATLIPTVTLGHETFSGNGHGAETTTDSSGRMQKLEGIDYKRAALEYPRMLDAERSYYLRTKPFYNLANKPAKHTGYGMDPETHRHFTDFANMAVALALPAGARILDVGCGSGWLSEYFARLGYDVTGIDISADLIRMAQERIDSVPYNLDHETQLRCRFLTHDIEVAPLAEKFDAVICYDSLHHLADERAVFRHLAAMLDIGGLLFILEGHKPESGSATETELCDVMRQFGTLESPFSTSYLRELFDEHGLAVVADHISVNGLFEREMLEGDRLPLTTLAVDYHYFTCMKVAEGAPASTVPDSRAPGILRATLTARGPVPRRVARGALLDLPLTIRNVGDTLWLSGRTVRAGIVMPAIRIMNSRGEIVSEVHGQPMLPCSVAPGKSVTLDLRFSAPDEPGGYQVKIDLVDQHICWFEEQGSTPLVFSFTVE